MRAEILEDLRTYFGAEASSYAPVNGGWLNKKWRAETSAGTLLVKQYSRERFSDRQLLQIEQSLLRQRALKDVPCPQLLCRDGIVLRFLEDGTVYMAMEFCSGHMETPRSVTRAQLYDLGRVLAMIQRGFARLPADGVRGWPLKSAEVLENLRAHCDQLLAAAEGDCRRAALREREILSSLSPEMLDGFARGISHEDFTPDNMLFEDGVSAILDFDRNQYGFLLHDVGRALASFCLTEEGLNAQLARALLEGYGMPFERGADALRIVGIVEMPWWVNPSVFEGGSEKTSRFLWEVLWIMDHWFELDSIFR